MRTKLRSVPDGALSAHPTAGPYQINFEAVATA